MKKSINIFCKQPETNSSDYTNKLKSTTILKNLNNTEPTIFTKYYIKCNNRIIYINSYDLFLNMAKGYFLLKCKCKNKREYINSMYEGNWSFIDVSDKDKHHSHHKHHINNKDHCCANHILHNIYYKSSKDCCNKLHSCKKYKKIDCREFDGLITPLAKLNPPAKDNKFKFPIILDICNLCCDEPHHVKPHKCHPHHSNSYYTPHKPTKYSYNNTHHKPSSYSYNNTYDEPSKYSYNNTDD